MINREIIKTDSKACKQWNYVFISHLESQKLKGANKYLAQSWLLKYGETKSQRMEMTYAAN